MAEGNLALKLQEAVNTPESKNSEEITPESSEQDTKSSNEEIKDAPVKEPDKLEIPGVPVDKDGKRPSENTIDFDKLKELLPDDVYKTIDQRFRSLYKQVKSQDRYLDQLGKDLPKMIEAKMREQGDASQKSIDKLTSVVSELSTKDASAKQQLQLNELEKKKTEAYQNMEFDKVAKIDTEIIKILNQPQKLEIPKAEVKTKEPEDKPDKKKEDKAEESPTYTREQAYLDEWTSEVDSAGNWVRPWAQPSHPLYEFATQQGQSLRSHPHLKNADLPTLLETLDNVMQSVTNPTQPEDKAQSKTKNPPEVLNSDANIRSKKSEDKLKLTSDQMAVAERIYPKLPAKEAHAKYLAGLKKVQNQ